MYFTKHPDGPELPEAAQSKHFRSFVDMATWAETHLPYGKYWARNPNGGNLATRIREVRHERARFWVEGRGNV
jgi:hypothetical protein